MLRALVRLIGFLLLAGGFVLLVVDGTATIADDTLRYTRLIDLAQRYLPAKLEMLQPLVVRTFGARGWDPVVTTTLQTPSCLVLLLLGILLLVLARRREPGIGHPAGL